MPVNRLLKTDAVQISGAVWNFVREEPVVRISHGIDRHDTVTKRTSPGFFFLP
jgi:hypothetical protein